MLDFVVISVSASLLIALSEFTTFVVVSTLHLLAKYLTTGLTKLQLCWDDFVPLKLDIQNITTAITKAPPKKSPLFTFTKITSSYNPNKKPYA